MTRRWALVPPPYQTELRYPHIPYKKGKPRLEGSQVSYLTHLGNGGSRKERSLIIPDASQLEHTRPNTLVHLGSQPTMCSHHRAVSPWPVPSVSERASVSQAVPRQTGGPSCTFALPEQLLEDSPLSPGLSQWLRQFAQVSVSGLSLMPMTSGCPLPVSGLSLTRPYPAMPRPLY